MADTKLADGVEFHLGMKIYKWDGKELQTDEELHSVKTFPYSVFERLFDLKTGESLGVIGRMYASDAARIKDNASVIIERIQWIKTLAEKEIKFIEDGGDPQHCFLNSDEVRAVL